jgi:DNA (cytosine-5)-methyltransferase 1
MSFQIQLTTMDYSNKTCKELIAICKEQKIKGYSGKKKDEIILLLHSTPQNEIILPVIVEESVCEVMTDVPSPQMDDSINIREKLEQILSGKEIETVELYKKLLNHNRTDHSNGVYYTPSEFFESLLTMIDLSDIQKETRTLDFCCGTGNLFMSYLTFLKTKYSDDLIKDVIMNAVFIDIDESAIEIFKLKLYCWIKNNIAGGSKIDEIFTHFYVNDGLLEIDVLKVKFHVILSNPPFINLKIKNEYKKKIKDLKYYQHSVHGMMDTYLIAIERIVNLLAKDGYTIIICPSQILTNISCFHLRKHILDSFSLINIFKFPEKNKIFPNITQSLCILHMKNDTSHTVQYHTCDYNREIVLHVTNCIDTSIYKKNDYNIISFTHEDTEFLNMLMTFPKFHSYDSIKCVRGNIDVTLDKEHICDETTAHPLIRGKNIRSLDTITEYISTETVQNKKINVTNKKLVCQQICNMNSENRLTFTIVDSHFVVSNSCNYIVVTDERYLTTLMHLLNSNVLNRYFEIFSGNNHISINEIHNFPLPNIFEMDSNLEQLSSEERELAIYELYHIDKDFACKYLGKSDSSITIYNHVSQKMSELEQEMAVHITPGGNWKDIPITMTKSERLNNIRTSGGRTTLYGRLDYNKPGFTITVQFSRLPNSSNLHPTKNRMITNREAGLLQSFPIDFKFNENKNVAIKQIGNAVPPLLARFIANLIKNDISNKNTLDLFSGVGGMSIGFSQEGFTIVLSNELDEKLANEMVNPTYHGNTMYVCGDICDSKTKDTIKEKLKDIPIGVIIGGPPCQGFSLAGKRDSDDTRNKLYIDYFKMIETYHPECFVMENVKGILSMKNEKKQLVIDEIKGIATTLGYKVSIFKLNACDYAVPQKRERVFIIGHKSKVYPQPLPMIHKKYISVRDAIEFLEPYEEHTEFKIPVMIHNPYIQYLSGMIDLQALYKSYS